jgi:4-hydroxythreonine-4-phosphate dehydrogenase
MTKPTIAISVGDPCGIGPEITVKALIHKEIYDLCNPLVIADGGVMKEALRIADVQMEISVVAEPGPYRYQYGTMTVLDLKNVEMRSLAYGKITKMGGEASFQYIAKAIELALSKRVQAVTTGPIHKEALNLAGHHYAGHTEIFADLTHTPDYCMMLLDKGFRVSHVTTHVALSEVSGLVKKDRILGVIRLTNDALIKMGITSPRIAVAGLNPHAGDGGLFGKEEILEIAPAVNAAQELGIKAEGPISPDTVFVRARGGEYDVVVVMYHDQGHIPIKMLGFRFDSNTGLWGAVAGINITLGLPIIRTSVDHGVAFDQAAKGTANPDSMLDALKLAAKLAAKDE